MGLTVEVRPFGPHPLMGLGVDDLRWMLPVRPGDVLHVEGEVLGAGLTATAIAYVGGDIGRVVASAYREVKLIPSRNKRQGIAKIKWTAYNQRGEGTCFGRPAWRALSRRRTGLIARAVAPLDQGKEPKSSGDRKSQGSIRVTDLNYGAVDGLVTAHRANRL